MLNTDAQLRDMTLQLFDLIAAKQAEYDTYQGYLEAGRDYWIEHVQRQADVGGRLPDDNPSVVGPAAEIGGAEMGAAKIGAAKTGAAKTGAAEVSEADMSATDAPAAHEHGVDQ